MDTPAIVNVLRETVDVELASPAGGKVTLYKSLILSEQIALSKKYPNAMNAAEAQQFSLDAIACCLVSWNLGKDGVLLPLTAESLATLPQATITAMMNCIDSISTTKEAQGKEVSA